MHCVICGGILAQLGQLGNLLWLRCLDCGMDQSTNVDTEEDTTDDEETF